MGGRGSGSGGMIDPHQSADTHTPKNILACVMNVAPHTHGADHLSLVGAGYKYYITGACVNQNNSNLSPNNP